MQTVGVGTKDNRSNILGDKDVPYPGFTSSENVHVQDAYLLRYGIQPKLARIVKEWTLKDRPDASKNRVHAPDPEWLAQEAPWDQENSSPNQSGNSEVPA